MRRALAGLRFIATVVIAGVALAAATLLVLPKALGWQGVIVLTGSMEPTLRTGGIAFVDPVSAEDVHLGDVITFRRPGSGEQVTHRVIEISASTDGPRFRTKGDANDIADEWVVRRGDLVGKVRYSFPYLGRAIHSLMTQRTLLALVMLAAAAFLLVDDVRRGRARRADDMRPQPAPAAVPRPAPAPALGPAPLARWRPGRKQLATLVLVAAVPVLAALIDRERRVSSQ